MFFFPLVLRLPCLVKEYWGGSEAQARQTWVQQAAKPGKSLCSYGSVVCSTPTKKYQASYAVLSRKIPSQKVAWPAKLLCPHRPKTSRSCPDTGSWGRRQRESHKHLTQTVHCIPYRQEILTSKAPNSSCAWHSLLPQGNIWQSNLWKLFPFQHITKGSSGNWINQQTKITPQRLWKLNHHWNHSSQK